MRTTALVFATAALALLPRATWAQSGSCRSNDYQAANLVTFAVRLVSDTALDADRRAYGLPRGNSSDVQLIQDESTCAAAASAYNVPLNTTVMRQVHVVRAGTRYIVLDPNERGNGGEFMLYMVFDNRWRCLAKFVG